ncbi:cell division protein FtsA [Paenalkalicoccus suaedae]|uniref:Cell division protein FtsA n=1 Tax=Paenalkalicoccus suaedae TaxID=2592382 RepID=A0A859FFC8_9BACI|nr:cell division protein FtsA [Paenalkalicoccus suaedae]QKS71518.1 cell division protein FtsA [Paenalkalicoccus suaedae]
MNQESTYVALDIGTSSVKIIIGEMTNGSLNIIGVGEAESKGMKKGAIVDIDDTIQSIRSAVEKAERMIGMSIKNVIVGITGNHIKLQHCHGVVAVSSDDREIGDVDVTRVIEAAQVMSIPPEREIIDVIPRQFIVDGLDEINDPRGMIGVRLEMEGTIITGSKTMLHNVLRCVEKAGLTIADLVFQPLAAGSIALSKDERGLGVALIDLGGGQTTVSVFEGGVMHGATQIPIGGDHVSNDISIGFRTSAEEADVIKLEHGHALISEASDDDVFQVTEIGSNQKQEFSQWQLANIMEPRLEEILTLVAREVDRLGFDNLPGGFVLIGGNAKTQGVLELARDVLNANVRISVPDYLGVREPHFTNGVGLITFAHRNAKIQGKELRNGITDHAPREEEPKRDRKEKVPAQRQEKEGPGLKSRVSKMFKSFLE